MTVSQQLSLPLDMKGETRSAVEFLLSHFDGLPGYAQVVAIGDKGIATQRTRLRK
jgi:hypothetical protein